MSLEISISLQIYRFFSTKGYFISCFVTKYKDDNISLKYHHFYRNQRNLAFEQENLIWFKCSEYQDIFPNALFLPLIRLKESVNDYRKHQ